MIRNTDLFSIATSGINASNRLLNTTSNNIANVNTEGYVRERTEFKSQLVGGVDIGTTERVINQFAQNQLRRDTTQLGEFQAFKQKTDGLDNVLANEANSISTGLSEFFAAIQTSADDPTNLASRDLVLGDGKALLRRMQSLSDFMLDKEEELNLEFESQVNRANSLIQSIGELNEAIIVANGNNRFDQPGALLNERDLAINELASLMSIEVRESPNQNGSKVVNLTSGESLVLEDGSFNLLELGGDADPTFKQLQLTTSFTGAKQNTTLNIFEDQLGGSIGGLFRYRDEVLNPAQRDLGQLALAFTDAVNTQNRLGMDLDQQLGGDIFVAPTFQGLTYQGTDPNLSIVGQITRGAGSTLTDADYKITVTSVTATNLPDEVTVELLNGDGSPKVDENNAPIVFTNITINSSGFSELPNGFEINFDSAGGYGVGNEFLLQPTRRAASDIEMATNRAEDLAFALPIRVDADLNNLGGATLVSTRVTNTTVDAALGAEASAFDGSGGIHDATAAPGGTVGAPVQIDFTSATSYEVRDVDGNLIVTVTGVTDYNNLLEQASNTAGWPAAFSALDNYPGYDFSLEGEARAGDSFTIAYNTDGFNDNRNALAMGALQRASTVQLSSNSSSTPRTFHEAYASVVSRVGEDAASADVSLQAAEAMYADSTEWNQAVSGVSLDEEAANLVRFQQTYAAAARILSAAQDMFDTILSVAR
ncbi:flagellar hook-associated protein FlgK [Alteromonas sp. ASW11-36]|uniref:Flagellar hook-associated protein 1 n=1 Tax=Alteromonas arenosi TaxID=3055817 RepID=A0ABT7SVH1_9ALTE|nr:flagellar hook-associated protein FlgK [Alteromonas sp. ASW11-36]MDM7860165.1 flagellar hook-associated protein FlgK [Alteromonas sp. ASW11-36]